MRPSRVALTVLLALATLVGVTLLVAWLLEDVIFFSLFVGIPAGVLSAAAVAAACVVLFGRSRVPLSPFSSSSRPRRR
jgi:preprotein translocase subunit SecF